LADILITGMSGTRPMGAAQPEQDVSGATSVLLQEQSLHEISFRMPPSPLREAFELIHFYLLHGEEGVEANAVRLSILEQIDIDPDFAMGEAVRTGLVEAHTEPVTTRKILRRGPRSAEMLRLVYGRDNPPTLESIRAATHARHAAWDAMDARLEALREAGRPKERNTVTSLPAWLH